MTILSKILPSRKVGIRLIRDDFSSPSIGNVWIGRELTLPLSTAAAFMKNGYAEFLDDDGAGAVREAAGKAVEHETTLQETEKETAPAENLDSKENEKLSLEDAIYSLNHKDDAHWTKSGLPDLNVLKELTGVAVKRQDVEEVAPEYTREDAAEIAEA